MTMLELSVQYRESAQRINERIEELTARLDSTEDVAKRSELKERIKRLSTMLHEARDLAVYCERYYRR